MKRNVALVIATLQSGGAERVLSAMANYWARKEWEVTLITFSGVEGDFYKLEDRVRRIGLDNVKPSRNPVEAIVSNLHRVFRLNRALSELNVDLIISFLDITNVTTLLSTVLTRRKVIVSERNDIVSNPTPPAWRALRNMLYKRAAAVVVQTDSQIVQAARIVRGKTLLQTIPNPVAHTIAKSAPVFDVEDYKTRNGKLIIGMGRLEEQKGFDMLIRAFAEIQDQAPDWRLVIFGDGSERRALQRMIDRSGLQDRIALPGVVSNTDQIWSFADLFVLSSRYEGFPNVLLEAMSNGVSVVSFDCPSGPADIIEDGLNGVLVPKGDEDALAKQMAHLINDPQRRQQLGEAAKEVAGKYAESAVMAQWEGLIERIQR